MFADDHADGALLARLRETSHIERTVASFCEVSG